MSTHVELAPEFDLADSDDGPLSYLEFINGDDPDTLQSYEASRDAKALLTLSPNPPPISNPASSPESTSPSFPDSSSEPSSSKQTSGSGYAAGDVTMTDGMDLSDELKLEDLIHTDHNSFASDGTINPLSIENPFGFQTTFDIQSPASTPSPFASGVTEHVTSPQLQTSHRKPSSKQSKSNSHGSRSNNRGHHKTASQQYSLTQSMGDLKTKSREVSPVSNMAFSQDSSPSAMFNNSPSPAGIDFMSAASMGLATDGALFANFSFSGMPNTANGHVHNMFGNHPMPMAGQPLPMFQQPIFGAGPLPPCRLIINQTPLKSRVETQIPVKLRLSPLPPGIKRIHLPRHTISKPKLIAKPRPERSPDMLELTVMLVCTSAMQNPELRKRAFARAAAAIPSVDPKADGEEEIKPQDGGEVHICTGCITRERKRAARKKAKKPEEEENWTKDEHRRVVVFNTHEVKEWRDPNADAPNGAEHGRFFPDGTIDAPMRIACYCRHHQEKSGFRVIFTLKDHMDKIVAQQLSDSIMITDDHKTPHTAPVAQNSAPNSSSETSLLPGGLNQTPSDPNSMSPDVTMPTPVLSTAEQPAVKTVTFPSSLAAPTSQAISSSHTPRNLSRPVSPNGNSGPSAKKRKSSGGMTKVPSTLAMTRLETTQLPGTSKPAMNSAVSATSPFSPSLNSFGMSTDSLFATNGQASGAGFNPGPPTPNSNDQVLFATGNRSTSLDSMGMGQMYSAPASAHQSRAPSPNSMRNNANAIHQQQQQSQLDQVLASSMYSMPMNMTQQRSLSVIHKIIPNEGPKCGGIEVTILGGNFYQGLEVMFGDQKATTTTFWGESSLVCLLPPSPVSGAVLVTFKQNGQAPPPFSSSNKQQPVFKYVDDDEQQLMRTALSVLGHKMTGKIEDVRDVARRIIGGGDNSSWGSSSGAGQGSVSGNYNGFSFGGPSLESQLLKVLDLIDLDDSTHKARLNLQRRTGQTMLHLACSLGLHRFVAALLARGANPDARDKGGYTPLHIASLNNHHEIVRRLISNGADPTIRTLSGLTPADMSQSREVLKAIRRLERHARSRSGGSLHSRVSSATSLRSLWEAPSQPVAKEYTTEESAQSSGESLEYSEIVTSEEDAEAADSDDVLDMRRPRRTSLRVADDAVAVPPSPTAFEQLREQLQQVMAMHLPNLPAYFSQMGPIGFPNMPPLPAYQGFNSAPVLQRMSSLLPNMGGTRPGSADEDGPGDQQQRRQLDGKWWYLSSLVNNAAAGAGAPSAPPPAYEDIFPEKGDSELKQASAVRAAADAEADGKCAILYDGGEGASVSVETEEESESAAEEPKQLPALLQIGRKNAITKEQQDNLRRAHAEKRKGLRSDRNLFIFWIPILVIVLCATLYSRVPTAMSVLAKLFPPGGDAAEVGGDAGRWFMQQQRQPQGALLEAL